ncbi:MAG TPA: pitrilysin family protein [Dehalococcoidia bacterium]
MSEQFCQKTTLPNGLRILTAPMPQTRSVTLSIYVGAGSRYEEAPKAGLSHFVEHLCFKGTERRPTAREISEAIDSVGGVLNGGTDRELTVYYCKVARPHFDLALDVLTDMLRRPLFQPEEVEKERKVVIEELAMVADSPAQQVDILIDEILWPEQPLGRDVAGSEETVNAISRQDALDYLHRQYVPNNMVVSVAGSITHEEVVRAVDAAMGDWPAGVPLGWYAAVPANGARPLAVKYRRTEQAHLSLAARGPSSRDSDRHAADLLSVVLGEGMSSRLFQELREKRGLCYDVHSYTSHFQDTGAFTVYAGVDPKNAVSAVGAILEELARLRDGVPEEELHKARELTKGRMLLRLEDTRNVSGWLGAHELLLGSVKTPDEAVEDLERVTTDDLRRVAGRLLGNGGLRLAVVGPFRSDRRFAPLLGG